MRIGKLEEGEIIMKSVTGRLNADWRAVYRCFALLSWASAQRGDTIEHNRYYELCINSNSMFPISLIKNNDLFN